MANLLSPTAKVEKTRRPELAATLVDGDKAYIESWDIYGRQESQTQAGYNALGATATKGCANCKWFVSPNSCILVSGDISPTGLSNLYAPIVPYVPEPMPVIIVGSQTKELSFFEKVKSIAASLLPGAQEQPDTGNLPVMFFVKSADDRLRWFSVVTNNYQDRETDIFTSDAHREMVEWVEQTKNYPDLHLWHAGPLSKWGTTDWMDYDADNGFVVASGLVDADKEHVATALQEYSQKHALGTSHGFVGLKSDDRYIVQYRMLEISPLPLEAAANYGTHFGVSVKEIEAMPFTDARKAFLKDTMRVDDTTIASWESHVESLGAKMKDLGLNYKDMPEPAAEALPVAAAVTESAVPVTEPMAAIVAEPAAVVTAVKADAEPAPVVVTAPNETAVAIANLTDAMAQITGVLSTIVAEQKALKESVAAVGQSEDDKVASFFTSKMSKLPAAFDPTATPANVVVGAKSKEDELSWYLDGVKSEA